MIHLGILETGHNSEELTASFGRFGDIFARWLETHRHAYPFRLSVFHVEGGEFPASVEECDGYLITGSAAGVYEDHAWLEPLREFIREAVAARRRILGVCFGHQIVADALGGRVGKSAKGWGLGHHTYEVLHRDHWMQPPIDAMSLLACHQDQVIEPPPGARVLARSAFCEFAMLAIGEHVITVQAHPEFTPDYAGSLYESRRERFGAEVTDRSLASLGRATHAEAFACWALQFFQDAASTPASQSATGPGNPAPVSV